MEDSMVVTGVVYAEFSKEAGPIPKKYIPKELGRETAIQVAVTTLTHSLMGHDTLTEAREGFQVFPLVSRNLSLCSYFFTFQKEEAFHVPSSISLIFKGSTTPSLLRKCATYSKELKRISKKIKKARKMEKEDYVKLYKTFMGKAPQKKTMVEAPELAFDSLHDLLKTTLTFSPAIQSIAIVNPYGEALQSVSKGKKEKDAMLNAIQTDFSSPLQQMGEKLNDEVDTLTVNFMKRKLFAVSLKNENNLIAFIRDSHGKREETLIRLAARQLNREFL